MAENPPNAQLEAFLSGAPEPEPQQAPPATPESTPPAEPPKGPPEPPVVEPDDDGDPPEPSPGEPVVPRRALEDERHKRQNYVAQAAKFEAERDMLAKQLEELKRAPPQQAQQPAQPQYQPIDPAQDPAGYHARIQGVLLNERLNMSEMMLRKELGAEKVDAAIAEFKQHAAADPRLYTQLYQQTDPYGWMAGEVERLGLIRRVTTDPAGYEAELRAKWEAEANGTAPAPRVSPAAKLPPSLANVRSALPRSSSAYTGPQSLDDILGQRATTRH
jgi:hypothetical protein